MFMIEEKMNCGMFIQLNTIKQLKWKLVTCVHMDNFLKNMLSRKGRLREYSQDYNTYMKFYSLQNNNRKCYG